MDLLDSWWIRPSPAADWPASRWVPEFMFVEREIPCADRFVPIERDLVRLRKRRAKSREVEERRRLRAQERAAAKAERARSKEERAAERDRWRVPCPGCKRLLLPERLCGTCIGRERRRVERDTARYSSLPVTGVIVVLADGREVTLSPGDYSFFSNEAYARRIDERYWIALRLGLLAA